MSSLIPFIIMSGWAAIAGQVATSVINDIMAEHTQNVNQRNYERNRDNERKYQEQFYKKMALEMPSYDMQGMKDAGINPMMSEGNNSIPSAPSTSVSAPDSMPFVPKDFTGLANQLLQVQYNEAMVNNLKAQTEKTYAEVPNVQAQTKVYQSQFGLNHALASNLAVQNNELQSRIDLNVSHMEHNTWLNRKLEKEVSEYMPKLIESINKQMEVATSQIYLNNERGKSEYSRRQSNLAITHKTEAEVEKILTETLLGQISVYQGVELFRSSILRGLAENDNEAAKALYEKLRNPVSSPGMDEDNSTYEFVRIFQFAIQNMLEPLNPLKGILR